MHVKNTHQISIYETFAEHEIGQELKTVSEWLDRHFKSIGINPAQDVVGANRISTERLMIEACKHSSQLRTCHRRVVKKQIMAICNCKGEDQRRAYYGKLIRGRVSRYCDTTTKPGLDESPSLSQLRLVICHDGSSGGRQG